MADNDSQFGLAQAPGEDNAAYAAANFPQPGQHFTWDLTDKGKQAATAAKQLGAGEYSSDRAIY